MTADGNWNLVVSTPMGERRATLSATTDGSTLKGSQIADGNSVEIFDGMVNGNELSWKVSITEPMPMTLEFNGTWRNVCEADHKIAGDDTAIGERKAGRICAAERNHARIGTTSRIGRDRHGTHHGTGIVGARRV